jgi:membrane protease YdiL (CAAX protease family)
MSGSDDRPDPDATPPRFWIVFLGVSFEGGLGLLAWGVGQALGWDPTTTWAGNRRDAGLGLLSTLPLFGLFAGCLRSRWGPLMRIREFFEETVRPLLGDLSSGELALLALAAGLGEELLFRGLIQGSLANRLGTWPALALSSVLFGLAHPITRAYIVLAAIMGTYLGTLWILTGNILVPIVAHATYDFVALVWLLKSE